MPGGLAKTFIPTKEPELTGAADEWLARLCCFAFSVSPQPFVRMMNRATAEEASDQAQAEGMAPLQQWVKSLADHVIAQEFGAGDLEFRWKDDRASDQTSVAGVAADYVKTGIKSVNEVRGELGLDPVAGGDQPMVLTAQGPVALGTAGAAQSAAKLARYNQNHYGPGPQGGQFAPSGEDGTSAGDAGAQSQSDEPDNGRAPTQIAADESAASSGTRVAANGPIVTPDGIKIEQVPGPNPLDPQGVNQPISSQEQQPIAETLTHILNGNTSGLNPHAYENRPSDNTGAMLPSSNVGYTVFDVPGSVGGRGPARLIFENSGNGIYYTRNHYDSFYPVAINPR